MRLFTNTDDERLEQLLDAGVPTDEAGSSAVAAFLRELESAVPEQPTDSLEPAHLAAMAAAGLALARSGPDSPDATRPVRTDLRPSFGWMGLRSALANGWAIGALATAGILAFGGAAYAGVLPAPLQNAVAVAVRAAGIELPSAGRARNPVAFHAPVTAPGNAPRVPSSRGASGTVAPSRAGTSTTGPGASSQNGTGQPLAGGAANGVAKGHVSTGKKAVVHAPRRKKPRPKPKPTHPPVERDSRGASVDP